jgi:YVTN family beta-propeller protein
MHNKIFIPGLICLFCLKSLLLYGHTITVGAAIDGSSSNITKAAYTYADTIKLPKATGAIFIRPTATSLINDTLNNASRAAVGLTRLKVQASAGVIAAATNIIANQTVFSGGLTAPINFPSTGCLYTWINNTPGIGLPANGTSNIPSFTAINTGNSPITATITASPVASGFAYVPNLSSNNVSVIATATNSVIATIPVGSAPLAVSVSLDGSRVYIGNSGSNSVSVIATATNSVIAVIPVINSPGGLVVSPDGTKVYVCNGNSILVINTVNNTVISGIPVNSHAQGISISPDGNTLYITNNVSNSVSVVGVLSSTIIASIPVGRNPLTSAVTPDGNFLYVTDQYGGVSVINTKTNALLTTINIGATPAGISISPDGKNAYVADPTNSVVYVINTTNNTVSATLSIPADPQGISVTPDGKNIYVTNRGSSVFVINSTTLAITTSVNVGLYPVAIGNFITPPLVCTSTPVTFSITVVPAIPTITESGTPNPVNTSFGIQSTSTSFTLSGANLSSDITVTSPPGFEVSTDNVNFSSTVTVGGTNTIGPTTIYVRLAATSNAGAYSGNIVLSGNGATSVNVMMPNSTVSPAIVNVTGTYSKLYGNTLTDFTLYYYTPNFTFNLAGLRNGNTFKSIEFAFSGGTAATDSVGTYPGSVTLSDFEGDNGFLPGNYIINYFPFDLVVLPSPITITANDVSKPYGIALPNDPASINFTVSGLMNNETVNNVNISYGPGASAASAPGLYPISVIPSGAIGGSFSPGNYDITYKPGNLTVNSPPPPVVAYTGVPLALQTVYGASSASTNIQVSGTNISTSITITPPTGFEISTDNINFGNTTMLKPDNVGAITATTIYIRLAATSPANNYVANLALNSIGVGSINVPLTGIVTPAPLTVAAIPASKTYGVTLSGGAGSTAFIITGLQNGETVGSVTLTYDKGSAPGDPVGIYHNSLVPSVATGGSFIISDYDITYIPASITVSQALLTIAADNLSRAFATLNPTLTVTYAGFVNNDGPALLTILATVSTIASLTSPTGQYPIMLSGARYCLPITL